MISGSSPLQTAALNKNVQGSIEGGCAQAPVACLSQGLLVSALRCSMKVTFPHAASAHEGPGARGRVGENRTSPRVQGPGGLVTHVKRMRGGK